MEPIHEITLSGRPFKGPENAPVTIAVFSDYQCAPCARLEPLLRQVLDKYPHEVKLVMKHFPVLKRHRYALNAAKAALAADAQGKFRDFHDRLFEDHDAIDDAKIQAIAKTLGLDLIKFADDMMSPAVQRMIAGDVTDGRQAGVRGTPAVFINGKMLKNRSLSGFTRRIEAELKKKGEIK